MRPPAGGAAESLRSALANPDASAFVVRRLPSIVYTGVARVDPLPGFVPPPGTPPPARFATRPPVRPEEDGLRLGPDPLWAAQTGLEAALGSWRARASLCFDARSGGHARGRVVEGLLARSGSRHLLVIGRAPLRWGYGLVGSLLLGRSAPPLLQARWRTARPLRPPRWHGLGEWTGDVFLAYLDDRWRTVPNPLLFGHRFAWRPAAWLEMAGSRTILFGGRGRTRRLSGEDLANILLGRRENLERARGPGDSDQRASFELRAALPATAARRLGLDGGECFFEYAGEDAIHPPLPAAVAHLFGAAASWSGWQIRSEFAETVSRNRWYDTHSVYRDSHFYRGYPLGMSFGPDVESVWLGLWTPPAGARARLSRTEQLLGKISGRRERRVIWDAMVRIDAGPRWTVECGVERGRRVGSGYEPKAPALVRHAFSLRLSAR